MANLLVEVGNTALKAAWSEGTVLGKTFRYQGEKKLEYILSLTEKEKPEILTVTSGKPVTKEEEAVLRKECTHLLILDENHTGVLLKYGFPEYLTYDRVASLVAVRFLFPNKSCSVFDLGTTLKVDFLSSVGKYVGGNISLGCRTRFKALNRYSRTLPLIDTPAEIMQEGNSIRSSVESGVISGIMFEIEGYARLRPANTLVFTGGDAVYFAKKINNSIFVVSNLVMMGLALITDDYVKKYIQ